MNINTPLRGGAVALPFTKAANPTKRHEVDGDQARIPYIHRIPDAARNHFVAMCGEYVGTVLFLFLALGGTQVANNIPTSSGQSIAVIGSNPQQLQYIALSFGFSLAVNAWVFFRISGGLFNPSVTIGMCLIGAVPWFRGTLLFFVQILGGITAAALVACMFPGPLNVQTSLSGGTTVAQGLFIEMMLTAELVFTIFMLAAEKHKGTFIAPLGIGLSLFVCELVGVYFTGGSLNPARTFGPCVVNHSFHGYHWIYWLGPTLGSIVAAGFYKFIKALEFETSNPGQDASDTFEKKISPETAAKLHEEQMRKEELASRVASGDGQAMSRNGPAGRFDVPSAAHASPAMGSADDAYAGLADGGMHSGQNDQYHEAVSSPGMVVGDSMVRRLDRGSSYAV